MTDATINDYKDVPEPAFTALTKLEEFICDLDGKTVGVPTDDGNAFIDDGTVDADDAVRAFNTIVLALMQSGDPTDPQRGQRTP